jgi:hypothetical protein
VVEAVVVGEAEVVVSAPAVTTVNVTDGDRSVLPVTGRRAITPAHVGALAATMPTSIAPLTTLSRSTSPHG